MAEKAKEVAIEEAERIKSLAVTAARSGAYLYPLRVRSPAFPAHCFMVLPVLKKCILTPRW